MTTNSKLMILMLVLTLSGQGHTGKIFGGQPVPPQSRPYMVLVKNQLQGGNKTYCGGFLLREDFVMTAAHCLANSHEVFLGFTNYSHSKVHIHVESTFPRKDFNTTAKTNDLMLLKLSSNAKFTPSIRPIALAGEDDGSLPSSCSVSGWGRTNYNSKGLSRVLMEVNVTLVENCPKENSYCSEGLDGPGEGDSGGPLVCEDGRAYGVVSAGKKTTSGDLVHSYTKISDYSSWIDAIMNPEQP
ncbi:granzyme G-like [Cheilinus undulatus]|uniref:granzyme G-like n=1 Tax=Cheilinus undulatus TaxID=241271 RepID=UPI001BD3A931|nr:granzyme G-like [Cheilinus undulatus]